MPRAKAEPNSVDRKWIDDVLANLDMNYAQFAKAIGIQKDAFSRLLSGKRVLLTNEIPILSSILGVPSDEIMRRFGVDLPAGHSKGSAKLAGTIGADGLLGPAGPGARVVPRPEGMTRDALALRIVARGAPVNGWVLYYQPVDRVDLAAVGRWAIVKAGKRTAVGVLERGYSAGKWTIGHGWEAGVIMEDVAVESAAPVAWIKC